VTWAELIRKLQEYGFVELRTGKGSHRQFWHPTSKKIITVAVHTKKGSRQRIGQPDSERRRHQRFEGRIMTSHYPIVLEHEVNGTVSAYVVGVPGVFAAADTEGAAARAIR